MLTHIREDIGATMERDPVARSCWEVLTYYPGLHAVIVHRVAHACWRDGFRWLGRWFSHLSCFLTSIETHPGTTIGRHVFIDHGMGAVIGETTEIGNSCMIYQSVMLGGISLHRGAKRHPTFGRGAMVNADAKMLGDFVVGDGAHAGSDAVVFRPVSPGATAAGTSAHIIECDAVTEAQSALKQELSAYDITPGTDDPVSLALKRLINRGEPQQERIESIPSALDRLGAHPENSPNDPFNAGELKRMLKQGKSG